MILKVRGLTRTLYRYKVVLLPGRDRMSNKWTVNYLGGMEGGFHGLIMHFATFTVISMYYLSEVVLIRITTYPDSECRKLFWLFIIGLGTFSESSGTLQWWLILERELCIFVICRMFYSRIPVVILYGFHILNVLLPL